MSAEDVLSTVEEDVTLPRLYLGDANLAWCAGLYEGEGCVLYSHSLLKGKQNRGPLRIRISSTDQDVLELFRTRSGVGAVSGPHPPQGLGKKPVFHYVVNGFKAIALLRAMQPWLGQRRSQRIDEKIAEWEARPLVGPKTTRESRDVIRAERAVGDTLKVISERHGVSLGYVSQICSGYAFPDELEEVSSV